MLKCKGACCPDSPVYSRRGDFPGQCYNVTVTQHHIRELNQVTEFPSGYLKLFNSLKGENVKSEDFELILLLYMFKV